MTYDPGQQPYQPGHQPQYGPPAYGVDSTAPVLPPLYPGAPPPRRRRSTTVTVTLIVIAAVVVLGGVAALSAALRIGPAANLVADRGVEACKAIAASTSTGSNADSASGTGKFTASQYQQIRKQFTDSRYSDIRTAGDHFVDLLWQAQGVGTSGDDSDLAAALALFGPLVSGYSDLSGACANHGIVLPPLSTS